MEILTIRQCVLVYTLHVLCIGHPLLWGHDDEVVDGAYRQQHLGAQRATLVCMEEALHPFESLVGGTILVLAATRRHVVYDGVGEQEAVGKVPHTLHVANELLAS